jgi:hypothetical protein
MPVVEKTAGGRVYVRAADQEFAPGDRADVDTSTAEYLLGERDDFERVDGDDSGDAEATDEDDVEVCGAPLSDGGTCDRPADECPYHGDDSESDVED